MIIYSEVYIKSLFRRRWETITLFWKCWNPTKTFCTVQILWEYCLY